MLFSISKHKITLETISLTGGNDDIGIYINKNLFDGKVARILYILFPLFVLKILSNRIANDFDKRVTVLAAYPDIEQPLFLYKMGSEAEKYCEKK